VSEETWEQVAKTGKFGTLKASKIKARAQEMWITKGVLYH
jgi:hypothetical protein